MKLALKNQHSPELRAVKYNPTNSLAPNSSQTKPLDKKVDKKVDNKVDKNLNTNNSNAKRFVRQKH